MKKFVIFKKLEDENGIAYGEKLGSYEAEMKDDSSANRSYLLAEPMASHFEVPSTMVSLIDVLKPVYHEAVESTEDRWVKEGFDDVYEQPMIMNPYSEEMEVDESWEFIEGVVGYNEGYHLTVDANLLSELNVKKVAQEITDLYNEMNKEVYEEMEKVFGTSNADSAVAYERTWNLMVDDPAAFVESGVVINGVTPTEQQLVAYAESKLNEAKQYAIWRLNRIEAFRLAKQEKLLSN